jgi:excisionase family DNA binding protein
VPHYKEIGDMLTTGEVSRLLGVPASTVRRWSDRGEVKAYRIGPRGERRFRRADVAAYLLNRAIRKYLKAD